MSFCVQSVGVLFTQRDDVGRVLVVGKKVVA